MLTKAGPWAKSVAIESITLATVVWADPGFAVDAIHVWEHCRPAPAIASALVTAVAGLGSAVAVGESLVS